MMLVVLAFTKQVLGCVRSGLVAGRDLFGAGLLLVVVWVGGPILWGWVCWLGSLLMEYAGVGSCGGGWEGTVGMVVISGLIYSTPPHVNLAWWVPALGTRPARYWVLSLSLFGWLDCYKGGATLLLTWWACRWWFGSDFFWLGVLKVGQFCLVWWRIVAAIQVRMGHMDQVLRQLPPSWREGGFICSCVWAGWAVSLLQMTGAGGEVCGVWGAALITGVGVGVMGGVYVITCFVTIWEVLVLPWLAKPRRTLFARCTHGWEKSGHSLPFYFLGWLGRRVRRVCWWSFCIGGCLLGGWVTFKAGRLAGAWLALLVAWLLGLGFYGCRLGWALIGVFLWGRVPCASIWSAQGWLAAMAHVTTPPYAPFPWVWPFGEDWLGWAAGCVWVESWVGPTLAYFKVEGSMRGREVWVGVRIVVQGVAQFGCWDLFLFFGPLVYVGWYRYRWEAYSRPAFYWWGWAIGAPICKAWGYSAPLLVEHEAAVLRCRRAWQAAHADPTLSPQQRHVLLTELWVQWQGLEAARASIISTYRGRGQVAIRLAWLFTYRTWPQMLGSIGWRLLLVGWGVWWFLVFGGGAGLI